MSDNTITVSISMGDDYRPTARIAAAVQELSEALAEAHGDDVQGFASIPAIGRDDTVSGVIQKMDASWKPGGPLNMLQALCNNEVIEGVFKF